MLFIFNFLFRNLICTPPIFVSFPSSVSTIFLISSFVTEKSPKGKKFNITTVTLLDTCSGPIHVSDLYLPVFSPDSWPCDRPPYWIGKLSILLNPKLFGYSGPYGFPIGNMELGLLTVLSTDQAEKCSVHVLTLSLFTNYERSKENSKNKITNQTKNLTAGECRQTENDQELHGRKHARLYTQKKTLVAR